MKLRQVMVLLAWCFVLFSLSIAGAGCASKAKEPVSFSREKLLDPETCMGCHPNQFKEWASSMHAYASDDPVFVAMNKRGQREAKLGTFCVKCHAPMAVNEGLTKDGLNLASLPQSMKGVTCYFCHNVEEIEGTHNNPLTLANDTTMRASISDPVKPSAHGVAYSKLLDGRSLDSSKLCGSCHDIVTPNKVHLERTYAEWQNSIFAKSGPSKLSCNQCHMDTVHKQPAAMDPDVQVVQRDTHTHLFAGVDTALTDWPNKDLQRKAIDCLLEPAVRVLLTPNFGFETKVQVDLETSSGHRFPSGASQDRRAWLELTAYDKDDKIIYHSGGNVKEGGVVAEANHVSGRDPNPAVMTDPIYDKNGNEALMFWDAVPHDPAPETVTCQTTLPETMSLVPGSHTCTDLYHSVPAPPATARLRTAVHVQPIAREVLDSLVASGDLDPKYATASPTLTLDNSIVEWKATDGQGTQVMNSVPSPLNCPNDYLCELYPDQERCQAN